TGSSCTPGIPASKSETKEMFTTHMPSSRASVVSGCWVMESTSQPIFWKNWDSARVENLGPGITTEVPVGWKVSSKVVSASWAVARSAVQYGSATETCTTSGPSKKVSARPEVRSTNWSVNTKSPGA